MESVMFEELDHNRRDRRHFLAVAAMTIAAARFGVADLAAAQSSETTATDLRAIKLEQITPAAFRLPIEGELPSLRHATACLNSQPLTPADLRGKVVLVEFWTYSCINWRRQLPYVRAWAEKYKDQGLVVIGVHAPEFAF
jgi:thiol-disulfide isomerase/thioredoxin